MSKFIYITEENTKLFSNFSNFVISENISKINPSFLPILTNLSFYNDIVNKFGYFLALEFPNCISISSIEFQDNLSINGNQIFEIAIPAIDKIVQNLYSAFKYKGKYYFLFKDKDDALLFKLNFSGEYYDVINKEINV